MRVYPYESYPQKELYDSEDYFDDYPYGSIEDGDTLYVSCIDIFDEYNEDIK